MPRSQPAERGPREEEGEAEVEEEPVVPEEASEEPEGWSLEGKPELAEEEAVREPVVRRSHLQPPTTSPWT